MGLLSVIVSKESMNKSDGIHLSEFNETFQYALKKKKKKPREIEDLFQLSPNK